MNTDKKFLDPRLIVYVLNYKHESSNAKAYHVNLAKVNCADAVRAKVKAQRRVIRYD
jgi:hypothetical protein